MGLKATGCYMSRTLSYAGAEFQLARCDLDPVFTEVCMCWPLVLGIAPSPVCWALHQACFCEQLV